MKKYDVKYTLMPMEYKNYSLPSETVTVFIVSKCFVLGEEKVYDGVSKAKNKVFFPYHIFWDSLEFKYQFVKNEGNESTYLVDDLFNTFEEANFAASIQNRTVLCEHMRSLFEQKNVQMYESFHSQHQAMCNFFEGITNYLERITNDLVIASSNQEKEYTKTI